MFITFRRLATNNGVRLSILLKSRGKPFPPRPFGLARQVWLSRPASARSFSHTRMDMIPHKMVLTHVLLSFVLFSATKAKAS